MCNVKKGIRYWCVVFFIMGLPFCIIKARYRDSIGGRYRFFLNFRNKTEDTALTVRVYVVRMEEGWRGAQGLTAFKGRWVVDLLPVFSKRIETISVPVGSTNRVWLEKFTNIGSNKTVEDRVIGVKVSGDNYETQVHYHSSDSRKNATVDSVYELFAEKTGKDFRIFGINKGHYFAVLSKKNNVSVDVFLTSAGLTIDRLVTKGPYRNHYYAVWAKIPGLSLVQVVEVEGRNRVVRAARC